ncbi:MAG: EamA family transporter [Armatimonadota bacterium]|nr:EamA family transporter [Armatimonadota bacterium]MDR5703182.1 EamA family transporter [Armatimonadota bacterium]MDR7434766.1 EamA family transporter [Armatimonadota bacterium]
MRSAGQSEAVAGYFFVLSAAVLWGSLGVAGKVAFASGVHPLEAAFYRAAFSAVGLLAFTFLVDRSSLRVHTRDLPLFLAFGLVSIAGFFAVYLYAIKLTTVAMAAILLYTAPVFVAALSRLFFREAITRTKTLSLLIAFLGCILVARGYDPASLRLTLQGTLAGIGSGITYAFYSIFGKAALRRYSILTTLTYAMGVGAIALGLLGLQQDAIHVGHSIRAWAALVYLALVTTLLAQSLYLAGLRRIQASKASIVATIEPVVAGVLGFFLLGESLELPQIVGGLLILAAVLAVHLGDRASGEA